MNPNQPNNQSSGVPGKKMQKKEQYNLPQTSQSKPNTKQQTTKKQNKPKEANQEQNKKENEVAKIKSTQKQSGGKNLSEMPQQSPAQDNQQIEQQIKMFKSQLLIPKRRNPKTGGSMGRLTEIEVNHLPINLDKLFNKVVYHIDVKFEPGRPKTLFRNALEEFNNKHYPKINFAFDGSRNMYTTKEIKGRTDLITVLNDENKRAAEFTIITSVVNIIQMNKIQEYLKSGSSNNPPGEAFQALDIILKNRPFSLRFTNIGRSFFPLPRSTPVDLGDGLEMWNGFFQSPVMGWKPYLNIDAVHKGFLKHQPLISYITNDLRCDPKTEMDSQNIKTLLDYVKGLKVEFMVPMQPNTKRLHKVVGIFDSASKFTFNMEDPVRGNQMVNVVQYFKIVRNYIIKYPNLPCLHVGNVNKKTAIPIELCTLQMGQFRMKKLTDLQTGNMVKNAARPPTERRQAIANSLRNIKYSQDPVLKEFGVDIKEQFASVPARVLDQPSLAYAHNTEIKPKAGIWKVDKFSKAVHIKNWVVLNLDHKINIISIRNFEKILMTTGKDLNVTINPMNPVVNCFLPRNFNLDEFKATIESIFKKLKACNTEIIFVVIPEIQTGVYGVIKQKSELEVGVLTQCIKSKTMSNMNTTTSSNLLLKINSKLNGTNHTLSNKSSPPCMVGAIIFGADVTHPTSEQSSTPSVAAVAASHDISGIQYNMEWRLQAPRVEIIQDLENIIHLQLIKFKNKTKTVPKKIFYFRDGVSDGQFLQLLKDELVAIRRACLRLHINYKPPVTFMVVQKRHHTRMFPKFTHDMDGKFGNVISGTVVDTQITHPTEMDFYLCSHSSIQGTSRPTKYHRIWDENYLTEDQLEQLTFYLCFMFARCTRAIAYPAPTYYAHLAAFRARAYLENKTINLNRLDDEQTKNQLNHSFTDNTPMFFV